ncbi:hypothetical protein GC173_04745 [bacterium]|nr:hypothetical protein [bacterium]
MMEQLPLGATAAVVAGLAARVLVQRFEVLHLRWAWDFLRESDQALSPEARETVLQRTHQALCAARLGRLAALMVLMPGMVTLVALAAPHLPADGLLRAVAMVGIGVLGPFLLLALLHSVLTLHFYTPNRASSVDKAPAWLTDDSLGLPGIIAAGWSFWDGLVRGGERLSRPFGLSRPQAWLVEFESQLLLAVGERELGAIDSGSEQAPVAKTSGVRTERDMVRAIQRLDETLVREVMRPLNNVTAISLANLTSEKFLNIARRTGYTRFPCYYDQVTNLTGYLNVHDFLDSPVLPPDPRKLIHEALFVPELGRLDLVLGEMQRQRQQIAICLDEYGGCSGLLSREDIIEEITGEVMDEYDRPELKVQDAHGAYLVDGTVDLDDLREMLGLDLTSDTYVTLSGYLYHRLSRVPRRGESIEDHDWRIEVVQLEGHRIRKVRLVPPEHRADLPQP